MRIPPCFVCGKPLLVEHETEDPTAAPFGGTDFQATGNWGSGVFDPGSDEERLHINICDDCMLQHAGRVVHYRARRRITKADFEQWAPGEAPGGAIVMTREEFTNSCKCNALTSDDGVGYYSDGQLISGENASPAGAARGEWPDEKWTHVVWFGK